MMTIDKDPTMRTYGIKKRHNLCYDVSGYFTPIAIRDQVVRAITVVNRAWDYKLITAERPLLILGAGFAGLAAALRASTLGVETVLVEKTRVCSNVAGSPRYISHLQYDWVADHWRNDEFPWAKPKPRSTPIMLTDGPILDLVEVLERQLEDTLEDGYLNYFQEVLCVGHKIVPGEQDTAGVNRPGILTASFVRHPPGAALTPKMIRSLPRFTEPEREFGMGLSCTGFPGERVFLELPPPAGRTKPVMHTFRGTEYWRIDKHNYANEGKTVVCGSGDGALQDFLLLATYSPGSPKPLKSARDIFAALDLNKAQIARLETAVSRIEDFSRRNELWWSKKAGDPTTAFTICEIYKKVHKAYEKEVDHLLLDPKNKRIVKNLDRIIMDGAREKLHLAHVCGHFEACYPLNRFLALMIGKRIAQTREDVFLAKRSVKDIHGLDGHTCNKDANECARFSHMVDFYEDAVCENFRGSGNLSSDSFKTVIFRFGLNVNQLQKVFGSEPTLPGFQIIPYICPDHPIDKAPVTPSGAV